MINFDKCLEVSGALWSKDHPIRSFHISFLFYKNRIVSIATNDKKTNPLNLRNPKINEFGINVSDTKYSCSEMRAFLKVRNTTNIPFHKLTLVNVRLNRNREFGFARPCVSCENLIKFCNIRKVFYTNELGNFVEFAT